MFKEKFNDDKNNKEKIVFRAGISPTESNKKIGPIRSHLYNYAFAKSEAEKGRDSKIIYRADDTNKEKHETEKTREIFIFFSEVLGFNFDITPYDSKDKINQSVFQSERQEVYLKYLEELYDKGVAFVDKKSGLTLFDIEKFIKDYGDVLKIDDLLMGEIKLKLEEIIKKGQKFFPLTRSDQSALYHLASTVDDADFKVTHVVRGQDKISTAEFQEMIRVALGFEPKKYLHTPMLLDKDGKLLSGTVKFDDFIKGGITPQALISYLVSSGYGDPETTYASLDDFIKNFDYKKIHKNNGKFDFKKLEDINKKIIKKINPDIYINSLILYFNKVGEDQIAQILKNDEKLSEILASLRRSPKESLVFVKNILSPDYEQIDGEFKDYIGELLEEIKKLNYEVPNYETLPPSKRKSFSHAITWILTGKYSFPSIEKFLNYFRINNLLHDRLEKAAQIYEIQNNKSEGAK
jgi:glutamyl-tRNA synthetase